MRRLFYFTCLTILACLIAFNVRAQEIDPEKILNDSLSELARQYPEKFQDIHLGISKRRTIFVTCWVGATRASPISDRAYCYALAIDIYNSISPDLQPELDELEPGEDVYEPNLRPVKEQFYDDIAYIDGNRPLIDGEPSIETKNRRLQRFKNRLLKRFDENSIEFLTTMQSYMESKYLRRYIRDQVSQSNIHLDAEDAPATIDASGIDLYNPTYYSLLKDYVDLVQPRIDALIPPWEE